MDNDLVTKGDPESSGISRRTLIKAGAVVGGTVWVAPVIESFTNKAAAVSVGPGGFPCSYATIIFTTATAPTTLVAVKINDPNAGCNLENTDGMYSGTTIGSCNGVTYAVDSNNVLTANGSEIPIAPAGSCSDFTINGCTITATNGASIKFVLIHDGSIKNGTLTNGTTVCGGMTGVSSFTVPSGDCGCG